MGIKLDLHVHTRYSWDSYTTLEEIVTGLQVKGIDGLAVTDHNTIVGALKLKEIAPSPPAIIVGEEIKTREGEIIGLFLTEEIPPDLTPEETVFRIKSQGGLVCIPHPFDRLRKLRLKTKALYRIIDQVDIIEAFNSRNLFNRDNGKAKKLAVLKGIPVCAGSDAHSLYELGRSYVEVENFRSPKEFLENLSSAKLVMKKSGIYSHILTVKNKYIKKVFPGLKRK
jgi:hypothetical protein